MTELNRVGGSAEAGALKRIETPAGTVEYAEDGAGGPPVVLLHGLLMDHTVWDDVIPLLPKGGFRYIRPVLPLGSHRVPLHDDADLSMDGWWGGWSRRARRPRSA